MFHIYIVFNSFFFSKSLIIVYVPNEESLLYLNNTIGIRDTGLFIFGCREDEELLMANGNRYGISSSVIDPNTVII